MESCACAVARPYQKDTLIYEMASATKSPDYYLEDNTMTQYGGYMDIWQYGSGEKERT